MSTRRPHTRTDNRYAASVTAYPSLRIRHVGMRHAPCGVCGAVSSRTQGVFASTRLLFWTSQVP